MPIIYVFKYQNCDADLIIVMLNADLHSCVKKGKSLLSGAIVNSQPQRLCQGDTKVVQKNLQS